MSITHSPRRDRFSRDGFSRLDGHIKESIPMQPVSPASSLTPSRADEKSTLFPKSANGFRRSMVPGRLEERRPRGKIGYDDDESTLNAMGRFYNDFMNFSLFTRYLVYIIPIGVLLAIPIVVIVSINTRPEVGGVRVEWIFAWLEVCWVGLWASKLLAHFLPAIFQFLVGIVSQGTRKYALILGALENQLGLAGWALISLSTFRPIMTGNPPARQKNLDKQYIEWVDIVQRVLGALLVGTLVYLIEKLLIQIISINYHKKQFTTRIQESKRSIFLLGLLYDASRAMFPQGCPEFVEEDGVIEDSLESKLNSKKNTKRPAHNRQQSKNPLQFMQSVGSVGTRFLANVAKDITGKQVFDSNSAHSIVLGALEKNKTAEALARRLWLSFVIEGNDALYFDDIKEVLGPGRETEADESFTALDRDSNGDVSLEEMILTVAEVGRERHAINNSMYDVDQAIKVLDRLLCTIVFLAVIFVFVAFLNKSFVTTLATAGTAFLSLSFVFSTTAQEVLGSCIFLFVKHPFDIGDKVEVSSEQLFVEHISLLYTVFRRVTNHQMVQVPNVVLNSLWIENTSRSRAMRDQISVPIDFTTSFEDVQLLKAEMQKFVLDKENSRDFFPEVDVQVVGIDKMDKMEIRVDVVHKSNWANETVRALRRSKLMCALVLAIRKVPINGPGGGGAALGSVDNPAYNVSVSDTDAAHKRKFYAQQQEAARLVPSPATAALGAPAAEKTAVDLINERNVALDGAQDGDDVYRGSSSRDARMSVTTEGSVLRRETTKGRRKSGRTHSTKSVSSVRSHWTNAAEEGNNIPEMPAIVRTQVTTYPNPMAAYYGQQRDPYAGTPTSPTFALPPRSPTAQMAPVSNSSRGPSPNPPAPNPPAPSPSPGPQLPAVAYSRGTPNASEPKQWV